MKRKHYTEEEVRQLFFSTPTFRRSWLGAYTENGLTAILINRCNSPIRSCVHISEVPCNTPAFHDTPIRCFSRTKRGRYFYENEPHLPGQCTCINHHTT